ncbi:CD209 antigen [Elysia marginata]|uniref:CD209 antigen n=1 Tax=Elysia marginata TaxID=1093978 RepID=A0AAV4H0H2_9GAST|nr:CD209 antigen [Elysia marginata]
MQMTQCFDLQLLAEAVNKHSNGASLEMNVKKTKTMVITKFPPKATSIKIKGNRVYCFEKEAFITLANGQECQTQQLGASWTSDIQATCYLECMIRYPETCQSIVYNAGTKTCTPGGVAFHPLQFYTASIPRANSPDQIYFAKQPVPPCDTSSGNFDLYDVCGVSLCLHVSSSPDDYFRAKTNCNQMGSRLFIANTIARLSVFEAVAMDYAKPYTWVGLTDIDDEGKFVWDNGEPLSDEQAQYTWVPEQPNGGDGQDCVRLKYNEGGLNDRYCNSIYDYICEPYNAYTEN